MRYVPELDGIRAIGVISVMLFHCQPHGIFAGGFLGVDLFFVLSAYLISNKLAEGKGLGRFYWHRVTRLYPALLFLLAAYLIVAPMIWAGSHVADATLAAAYLSDYSFAFWQRPYYLQHTWSLSVEEQFYLVWPIAFALLMKARRPIIILLAAYAAMMAWRAGFDWRSYYYRFDTHATGLILGAILFFWRPKLPPLYGLVGLALFLATASLAYINLAQWFIPLAELAALLMIAAPPRALAHPALVHIGKLSYALYLWHFPIAYWARDNLSLWAAPLFMLAASYTMALLSHLTVEKWGRALRDRIEAGRGSQVRVHRSKPSPAEN